MPSHSSSSSPRNNHRHRYHDSSRYSDIRRHSGNSGSHRRHDGSSRRTSDHHEKYRDDKSRPYRSHRDDKRTQGNGSREYRNDHTTSSGAYTRRLPPPGSTLAILHPDADANDVPPGLLLNFRDPLEIEKELRKNPEEKREEVKFHKGSGSKRETNKCQYQDRRTKKDASSRAYCRRPPEEKHEEIDFQTKQSAKGERNKSQYQDRSARKDSAPTISRNDRASSSREYTRRPPPKGSTLKILHPVADTNEVDPLRTSEALKNNTEKKNQEIKIQAAKSARSQSPDRSTGTTQSQSEIQVPTNLNVTSKDSKPQPKFKKRIAPVQNGKRPSQVPKNVESSAMALLDIPHGTLPTKPQSVPSPNIGTARVRTIHPLMLKKGVLSAMQQKNEKPPTRKLPPPGSILAILHPDADATDVAPGLLLNFWDPLEIEKELRKKPEEEERLVREAEQARRRDRARRLERRRRSEKDRRRERRVS